MKGNRYSNDELNRILQEADGGKSIAGMARSRMSSKISSEPKHHV